MKLEVNPYVLDFKFLARTSRGEMQERKVWFIKIYDEVGNEGVGEVAPINRLSPESIEDVLDFLARMPEKFLDVQLPDTEEEIYEFVSQLVPNHMPSVRFGLEMALLDLMNGGSKHIFTSDIDRIRIPINGLVWMGDQDFLKQQIKEKLEAGYRCIKLKVGSLDFDSEVRIIESLRKISDELVIRLDANGAFETNEVLLKLKVLSKFAIHSIEQPIMPMQPEAMQLICQKSDIPIALDEELIGVSSSRERLNLLQELRPHYLVLKPTLHGGFASVKEWIEIAEMHEVSWWITSYLESNIGLNAIAQFASRYSSNTQYHGLGTGGLYSNNISSPIIIDQGVFTYARSKVWGDC